MRRIPVWSWALAVGVIAGVIGGSAGEWNYKRFKPKFVLLPNWKNLSPYVRSDHLANEDRTKTPPEEAKNAALTYGVLGAVLGLGLGLVGGLARGSVGAALVAAVLGAILAAGAAAVASFVMVPVFFRNIDPQNSALMPFFTRGTIWVALGAFAGLAFGLGRGGAKKAGAGFCGGLIGAALGSVLYEVLTVSFFPLVRQLEPIPTEPKLRLIAHLLVAVPAALGAALAVATPAPAAKEPLEQSLPA